MLFPQFGMFYKSTDPSCQPPITVPKIHILLLNILYQKQDLADSAICAPITTPRPPQRRLNSADIHRKDKAKLTLNRIIQR